MPELNRPRLHVSAVDATLGTPPFELRQPDSAAGPTDDLILMALLEEVRGLRADLAARHAQVWWRRLLRWCRTVFAE